MFARALIVLLLVLNLGVAAWWLARAPMPPPEVPEPALGVARLQLPGEAPGGVATTAMPLPPTGGSAPQTAAALPAARPQCHSFGPYDNDQAAVAAQARLQPLTLRIDVRTRRATPARGWRVLLPPAPDRAQADASAQRIAAAGFSDYFVVRDGPEAHSIALGRYRGESAARARAATLVAGGFAARAEPIGGGAAITWLDVTAAEGFDAQRAQAIASAPQRLDRDCAGVP
ncbi:SPOR domain-containing protein [Lysobacter koreensis]|uniref:SPOR domain-containing protein n=1 Tax=Lysobacter koreensis TaxID=266122 RepID=A0ABW2YQX9_9GAMM